jgi:DNA-binding XRE family transcriptional regulator
MTRGHRLTTLKARRELAGLTIEALARQANVSDRTITQLEAGGNCDPEVTQRILDVLGGASSISSSSIANPSTITTAAAHKFQTGDTVAIAGHTGSTPAIDGTQAATRTGATTFTIPVNVTAGGTGGTATIQPASVGIARL